MIFGRMPLAKMSQSQHQSQMLISSQYRKQERFMFKVTIKSILEINVIKRGGMKYILNVIHDFK